METFEDVLKHYGIKGMRWGVHRDNPSGGSSSSGHGPSHDAVAAKEHKAKVRKGGLDALSNSELESLVKRMNLEKQFNSLQPPPPSARAKKLVADTLLNAGKQQLQKAANDQISKQIAKALGKR